MPSITYDYIHLKHILNTTTYEFTDIMQAHVNYGDDALTVATLRIIKAGEEILNYYGPHPNSELLRRYGYVTPKHSRYDVIELPWKMIEDALAVNLGLSSEQLESAVSFALML